MPKDHAQDDQFSCAKWFAKTEVKHICQRASKVRTRLETEDAHRKIGDCKEIMRLKLAKVTKAELCN